MTTLPALGQHPHGSDATPEPLLPVKPMARSASSSVRESSAGACCYLVVYAKCGPHIAIDVCQCDRCTDPDVQRKREQALTEIGYTQDCVSGRWFSIPENCNV